MKRTRQARTRLADELRLYALSFPEAYEEFPWGERVVKVNGKVFVFLGGDAEASGMSVKLPLSKAFALGFDFAAPTGYGLGKSGWVTFRFAADDAAPIELLKEWIAESYRAIAPKRLLVKQDGTETEPIAKTERNVHTKRSARARLRKRR